MPKRENPEAKNADSLIQTVSDRRSIRSKYRQVKHLINDERDGIAGVSSEKFKSILGKVESIHQHVHKPREQVADAEALLEIMTTLGLSVKAEINDGVNPADFVTLLCRAFCGTADTRRSMLWGDLGSFASNIFKKAKGCSTMIGPMKTQMKPRKAMTMRKHSAPTQNARPKELDNPDVEMSDTDKNMATMFCILKLKKIVKLEHLVLNRKSFAQTVENIFALSFLIKDGRVKIDVDADNCHLVSPMNAPNASEVASKEVSFFHFVFRFDFQDWKLMMDLVKAGEELMPHRSANTKHVDFVKEEKSQDTVWAPVAPIKTYSRSRGLVINEQPVMAAVDKMDTDKAMAD